MTNSVRYENGKLIISVEAAQEYLGHIASIRNALRGKEDQCDISSFKHDSGEDYLPFRILDGEFRPYIETCIGGMEPCLPYAKNSYLMKTMIGTLEVEKEVNINAIEMTYRNAREYNINHLKGPLARKVYKEIGDFHKIFWDSIKNGKDIEMLVSEGVYKLISITSNFQPKVNSIPLRIVVDGDEWKNSTSLSQEVSKKYISTSSVKVTYELTSEEHFCINAVAKTLLSQAKDKNFDIGLDSRSANEVIGYLSNTTNLNYQINPSFNQGFYLNVTLPNDFMALLVQQPIFKNAGLGAKGSIEIKIDRDASPELNAHIKDVIQGAADKFIDSNSSASAQQEIIEACALYLEYVGNVVNSYQ